MTLQDGELDALRRLTSPPLDADRRTSFDTEGVALARQLANALPSTLDDDSDRRWRLRARIARHIYERGAPSGREASGALSYSGTAKHGGLAYVILGPPASGKSTAVAEEIAIGAGAHVVDSDAVKELLPEFRGGLGASAVHEESALIAREMVLRAVVRHRENLVLALVGRTPSTVLDQVDMLKDLGYQVHVILIELPLEEAARRTVVRFHRTGRLVDPEYVLGIGDGPRRTFDRLKAEGGCASYARVSTNVPEGQAPVVVESSMGTTTLDEHIRSVTD